LTPKERKKLREKLGHHPNYQLTQSGLASVLSRLLGFAQILFFIAGGIMLMAYVFLMIQRKLEFNTH
jgi:succinate dehydrogenase/fumarate reductase cytochrome b subunit